MRRCIVPAVLAFVILAMLAPPGFAQAPAPKVTISGLFDQITSMGRNLYDGNFTRNSDTEWYGRTRFRPDFEFAVGRVRAVLGLELDLAYGQMGTNDSGFPFNNTGTTSGCKANTNGCLDLNTDVGGMIEIKWIYTEFPLTGKDSLLPFIPVETMARAGGQPFDTLASYKLASYANGDFAGISAITTFTPNIKTNLAYVIVEDELAGGNRGILNVPVTPGTGSGSPIFPTGSKTTRGEDWAVIFSTDLTPTKGLDIKPMYSYFHSDGLTSGSGRRNLADLPSGVGGQGAQINSPASYNALAQGLGGGGDPTYHENRYTIGADARWRIGGFGLDPTFYWQWGTIDRLGIITTPGASGSSVNGLGSKKMTADMMSFLFDTIVSYQLGPLLLEGRGAYSPGNKARDNLTKSIRYYQPLDTDGNFFAADWSLFFSSWSGVDYFQPNFHGMSNYVGYDRYGVGRAAFRATYNLTPSLSFMGLVGAILTAEPVDTDTNTQNSSTLGSGATLGIGTPVRVTTSQNSWVKGDSNYLGTELYGLLTWRFSPNAAFTLGGGYLFAGDALNTAECVVPVAANGIPVAAATNCSNGVVKKRDSQNAYQLGARIRLAF